MRGERPRDSIYATPLDELADFRFDERVAAVFPDMINRSVPGYGTVIALLEPIAERFAQAGSRIYDLGCSLGAATLALRRGVHHQDCRIIGIDNSEAMLERCADYLARENSDTEVELRCADIRDSGIENASLVVLNFTLQFVPVAERHTLIERIYKGLRPGGALLLAEKIAFDDPQQQELFTELHHGFKRANGYSDLEISQKRSALEKVLVPEREQDHIQRLQGAGFSHIYRCFQGLNFAAWIAVK